MAALALVAGGVPLGAAESGEEAPRTRATGNWFGMRTTAFEAGIDLQGGYVIDLQANPTGGREQDSAYAGLLQLDATVDMGRLLGAHGMTFYVAGTWGSGTDLSASVGNVFQVGQAFVARTVKLSQLFVAQSLAGGAVLLKGGRVSVAIDFAFLPIDQYLVNSALNGPPSRSERKDQTAASHPGNWPVLMALAEAIGYYPFTPQRLMVMPDDPALGEYRELRPQVRESSRRRPRAGARAAFTRGAEPSRGICHG